MKNKKFVFSFLLVSIVLMFILFQYRKNIKIETSKQVGVSTSVDPNEENVNYFVRPHSPRFGNNLARVTVVEWLDPECEACRAMHVYLKKIIYDYSDRVLFIIRYMPYHKNSTYAAAVLEESREMDRFDAALNILFDKQPEWADHQKPRPELIPTYLEKLGIPKESLAKDQVLLKHGDKIKIDQEDGVKVGVQGTPTFFINHKKLLELGERPLRSAIDRELELLR